MIQKILKENSDGTCVVLTMACIGCHQSTRVTVDSKSVQTWINGTNIERAFPDMNKDDRELLISGTHPKCWDEIFGGEEE